MKTKKKVFIVEDHPIMREGISQVINNEEDFIVCGEAGDVNKAMKAIIETEPHIAIVDISLEDGNGLDLVKNLKKRLPELPVLVLSMHDETVYAQRALKAGAKGYLAGEEFEICRSSQGPSPGGDFSQRHHVPKGSVPGCPGAGSQC